MLRHSFIALSFAACATSGGSGGAPDPLTSYAFDPALGIELSQMTRNASGLFVREFTPGTGIRATAGDIVRVRYTVHLADGTRIGGTGPDEAPFEFRLGRREVIAGWDEGISGMRVGARRQLVVPPSLGYGMRARGNIPPNSVLVFSLELLGIDG